MTDQALTVEPAAQQAPSRAQTGENLRVLALPLVYLLIYVAVHIAQIFVLELDSGTRARIRIDEFVEQFHAGILSAITIGICSTLLMLSLSTALRFRVDELAIAAPGSLFRLFTIFLTGQTLILVAGHISIFISAIANRQDLDPASPTGMSASLSSYASAADYVLVVTIFVALLSLWTFESYLGRVYERIQKVFPNRASHERAHVHVLATLAIIPVIFIVVKVVVGFVLSTVIHGPTVSIIIGTLELLVFIYTVRVAIQRT